MTSRTRFGAFLAAMLIAGLGTCDAASNCCDKIEAATSSDKILRDTSSNYTTENANYWSSSCILTPQCIFTPTSSSDVSAAIKILTRNNCQFAVRGGGHTPNPGWAGTSSGVLISLSKLHTSQVSADTKSVVVGAGSRWGDVYAETDKHNVTVAGGRASPVGVSGFLLGGGLSFLMHQVGFSANSVLAYEMVLANGTIVTATKSSYPDLFKAQKGGSGNFGIVTSYTLQTYPVNNVYAGNIHYSKDHFNDLFPLMDTYSRDGTESGPKSHVIFFFINVPSQSMNLATFYGFYSDPVTTPPPVIQPFVEVPTVLNTLKVTTIKEAVDELGAGIASGQRSGFHTYSIRSDADLFKQLTGLWETAADSLSATPGWSLSLVFQPISNSMIRASEERGGNVLGLKTNKDPLMVVSYTFTWTNAADDEKVYATINKLTEDSKKIARSKGKLADYLYMNYASSQQSVIESYGQSQINFLNKVKRKYDPKDVFSKLSPGGFKIPSQ